MVCSYREMDCSSETAFQSPTRLATRLWHSSDQDVFLRYSDVTLVSLQVKSFMHDGRQRQLTANPEEGCYETIEHCACNDRRFS